MFYHATSMQAFQQIMKDGAIRSSEDTGVVSSRQFSAPAAALGGIYFSDNKDDLYHLHENAVNHTTFNPNMPNIGVMLEVELDVDTLQPGLDDLQAYPEHKDAHDKGQVVHFGDIDTNRIKGVSFQYPLKAGAYVDGVGGMGMILSREFTKRFKVGKDLTLDESLSVVAAQNQIIEGIYKPKYERMVVEEQTRCTENEMERLRLVLPQDAGLDMQGNPKYMLAITRANDLDILTPDAVHSENPMLADNGPSSNYQYYASYSASEYEAIKEHAGKDGVFLAKTDRVPGGLGQSKRVVDVTTIERTAIPYNHNKHVNHTDLAREAVVAAKAQQKESEEGLTI